MEWVYSLNWSWFLIRLVALMIVTPFIGIILVRVLEGFEKAWKSNQKKKRWMACCVAFIGLALALGWFR